MEDPAPLVGIESSDSHDIIINVRPSIHPDNYWDATFESLRRVMKAFHAMHIQVAFSEGIELGKVGD